MKIEGISRSDGFISSNTNEEIIGNRYGRQTVCWERWNIKKCRNKNSKKTF